MKLFHLSDLHIGLRLFNRDLSEDQRYIFDQIADAARRERPDAILIAGDVYDKAVPSAEAVALFDRFVARLRDAAPQSELMIVSGNHDSAPRLNVYRGLLSQQRVHMIGLPPMKAGEHIERVTLQDAHGPVDFYLLPFVKPSMVRAVVGTDENGNNLSYDESLRRLIALEAIDTSRRNVLVSHQFYLPAGTDADSVARMDGEVCTVGNIDAIRSDVLDVLDYAALGHIHKRSGLKRVGETYYAWPGCPEGRGFDETGERFVYIAEIDRDSREVTLRNASIARRKYEILNVDISGAEPILAIHSLLPDDTQNDVYRIVLTGETDCSPDAAMLQNSLEGLFFHLQIRDETRLRQDIWEKAGSDTLRGIFLTKLKTACDSASDEEEKNRIETAARWGLAALDNMEVV